MQVVTKLVFVRSLSKILNHRGYSMGTDVVDKVCEQAKPVDGNGTIRRNEQPVIESIVIKTAD